MTAVLTVEVEDAKLRAGHVLVGLTVMVSAAVVQTLMAGIVEVRMCAMAVVVVVVVVEMGRRGGGGYSGFQYRCGW